MKLPRYNHRSTMNSTTMRDMRVSPKSRILKPDLDLKLPEMNFRQSFVISPKMAIKALPLAEPMKIPKELRFSSNAIKTDLDHVRNKIRRNKFDHLNFNSVLDIEEGQRYYRGIYEPHKTVYQSVDATNIKEGSKF